MKRYQDHVLSLRTPTGSGTAPLLEVRGLSKKNCFRDISFSLQRGEILGITGLLGSGRTELAMALFGIDPADEGEIAVDGQRIKVSSVKDAVEAGIGYVPEDRLTQGLELKKNRWGRTS